MSTAPREPIAPLQWLLLGGPFFTVLGISAVVRQGSLPSFGGERDIVDYLDKNSDALLQSRVMLLLALVGLLLFALALGDRLSTAASGLGPAPLVGAAIFVVLYFGGGAPMAGAAYQEGVLDSSVLGTLSDLGTELFVASLLGALLLAGSTALAGLLHPTVLPGWVIWASLGSGTLDLLSFFVAQSSPPVDLHAPLPWLAFAGTLVWPGVVGIGLLLRDRVTTLR